METTRTLHDMVETARTLQACPAGYGGNGQSPAERDKAHGESAPTMRPVLFASIPDSPNPNK